MSIQGFPRRSFLAGAALAAAKLAQSATSNAFDVKAYGAKADGKTLDTPAINKAIEAAAAAGGGIVAFPAGNYLSFSIRLKSHVEARPRPRSDHHRRRHARRRR